jgi:hypothetical protein
VERLCSFASSGRHITRIQTVIRSSPKTTIHSAFELLPPTLTIVNSIEC